ncbi:MAG: YidC/Oxa1 family membrane protein insertase [Anaerolineae bacterium]|jgi:YidC/Oxa1 family membrane protein insertase|nr:YidC/Oxa1 family membrane protein insertase [Anaerolineae bacterium]
MDFLVNPLVTLLALLYQVLGNNIVLAIVVLTIIIRVAVAPLMNQQLKSSAAMQELQPRIKKLQEKYKNDREKLSQAQMQLYREHGINPFGGCLPLLVQLPILLALYATISHALASTPYQVVDLSGRLLIPGLEQLIPVDKIWLGMDLTQAPQLLITSAPWALLFPILVLVTTWLQSKLTIPVQTQDPNEEPNPAVAMSRSMTTIMPLMFGFFSLSFPIGLSIYFIVGNLIGIAQYTAIGRADWKGTFGFGPSLRPLATPFKSPVDDADDEVIVGPNGNKRNAAQEVLKVKPATVNAVRTTSGGISSGGKKKRPKK